MIRQSTVIFNNDVDFDCQDLELEFVPDQMDETNETNETNEFVPKSKHDKFRDPYSMNRYHVRMHHFKDARVYDYDFEESGWQVQRWYARQMYNRWLRSIRKNFGWENFRRPVREIFEEQGEDGDTIVIRKLVPIREFQQVPKYNSGKNKKSSLAQSREKGVRPDDENFRGKMFTEKMGKEISRLRNQFGMTQAELGKKINVDANTVRDIEHGGLITFNSEDVMVRSLANALGLQSIRYQE